MNGTPLCELCPDQAGGMVIKVLGVVTLTGAHGILRLANSLDGVAQVTINLDGVTEISADAAEILFFADDGPGAGSAQRITVLTNGCVSRHAVLQAYAEWPEREPFAAGSTGGW